MRLLTIVTLKRVILVALIAVIGLFHSCGTVYQGQRTVSNATISARKLIKKPSDKRIMDFNAKYSLAQAEMRRLLNEAQYNPLVYGTIADNATEWMNLSALLRQLEVVPVRGVQHTLIVEATDYTSIVADSRNRACDAYYDEGVKIIQLSSNFQQRQRALTYFSKSMSYSSRYSEDIAYYVSLVYIEEADRLLLLPSIQNLSLARNYYNKALLSVGNPDQQQMIRNKIENIEVVQIRMLIDDADRLAMSTDPRAIEQAIGNYIRAAEMGSHEAAEKRQMLLNQVGIVVVISGERVSARLLDNIQRQLPNYVQVKMHSPLLGSRYDGDILIIPHRDWGRRDREGNFELSFEIIDLRRAGLLPYKLADFPHKAKIKESFEKVLERNQIRIVELIRNLGLNRPNTNRRF